MKIYKVDDTGYKIYYYGNDIDKNSLYEKVKNIVKSVQKKLKLDGFYKAKVLYKKIGLFIELIRIDDNFCKNTLDLKIEISDDDVYFRTKDYFIIEDLSQIRYFDGIYYCLVNDSFDKIIERIEFGEFIFGLDVLDIINKTYVI